MSLFVLYQVWCLWVYYFTRYHHLFILCDLWPSPVTISFCQDHLRFTQYMYLCCWMFVSKIKFVGSIKIQIHGHLYRENFNNVTMMSSPSGFLWSSYTNLQWAYQRGIPNFRLIKHTRAEIYSREINRELWRKNRYWVSVTLTFDLRSPILVWFKQLQ